MATDKKQYKIGRKGQADILFKAFSSTELLGDYIRSCKMYGLHLLSQSDIYFPTPKQRELVSYIELDGEEVGAVSVDNGKLAYEPFEYWIEFAYFGDTFFNKNNFFFNAIEECFGKEIPLWLINTYTGLKLKCYYAKTEINTHERNKYFGLKDFVSMKVYFRIPKPNECNFTLSDFSAQIYSDTTENPVYTNDASLYPRVNYSNDNFPAITF